MNRRTFIRVVGGVGLSSAVPFSYAVAAKKPAAASAGVLVEAASFAEKGGWKLDTQHYQQMGGCSLLAHGMGKPVANATARVTIPRSGKWNVWVRTRDWCPGDWQAPGRFQVLVDGKPLKPEFGVEGETLACGTGSAAVAVLAAKRFNWPDEYRKGKDMLVMVRSGDTLRVSVTADDDWTITDLCLETIVRFLYFGEVHPDLAEKALSGESTASGPVHQSQD